MNYLAHAYLSFNRKDILVGNMISDFVKGRKKYDYPSRILLGIDLHRYIDEFTDSHQITWEMKNIFKPHYGLYAGAFTDIAYDYFLANDKTIFHDHEALLRFSLDSYEMIEDSVDLLPATFRQMFPYMKQHNWLYNYRHPMGIEKSFQGLVKRAKYMDDAHTAFDLFTANLNLMQGYYEEFFPLLKKFSSVTLTRLLNTD